MARLQLNKSSLGREARNLQNYERFLPSLDLKRQQLMAERARAAATLQETRGTIDALRTRVGRTLPMLANREIDLNDLAKITRVELGTQSVVGAHLPTLEQVKIEIRPYAFLAKPHWVDSTAALLSDMLSLRMRMQVEERRLALLDAAVKKITQRVNLFDKVLVPRAKANIKRIRIYLSDAELAAVVRSKIAKRKHAITGTA